jgi:hypothetical protein
MQFVGKGAVTLRSQRPAQSRLDHSLTVAALLWQAPSKSWRAGTARPRFRLRGLTLSGDGERRLVYNQRFPPMRR